MVNSACNKIEIRNIPLYWPAGVDGAVITHTVSDDEGKLSKPEWDAFSAGTVCLTYDDFGWLRGTVEKLCSDHKGFCQPEVQAKLQSFHSKTSAVESRLRRRRI